jgi:hypothetical protein
MRKVVSCIVCIEMELCHVNVRRGELRAEPQGEIVTYLFNDTSLQLASGVHSPSHYDGWNVKLCPNLATNVLDAKIVVRLLTLAVLFVLIGNSPSMRHMEILRGRASHLKPKPFNMLTLLCDIFNVIHQSVE